MNYFGLKDLLHLDRFCTAIPQTDACDQISFGADLVELAEEETNEIFNTVFELILELPEGRRPETFVVIFTSRENADGAVFGKWFDGNVDGLSLKYGTNNFVSLYVQDSIYINGGSCSETPFYKILREKLKDRYFDGFNWTFQEQNITKACSLPTEFPPVSPAQKACYHKALKALIQESGETKTSCFVRDYGFVDGLTSFRNESIAGFKLVFWFRDPKQPPKHQWTLNVSKAVRHEYLVVTPIGLLGILGGTVGIFIGLSFFDLSSWLLDAAGKLWTLVKGLVGSSGDQRHGKKRRLQGKCEY